MGLLQQKRKNKDQPNPIYMHTNVSFSWELPSELYVVVVLLLVVVVPPISSIIIFHISHARYLSINFQILEGSQIKQKPHLLESIFDGLLTVQTIDESDRKLNVFWSIYQFSPLVEVTSRYHSNFPICFYETYSETTHSWGIKGFN